MAGLDILGGIGRGLTQGAQFISEGRQQRQQEQLNNAKLSMLQEEQDWRRQDRERAAAEQTQANGALQVDRKFINQDLNDPVVFENYTREMMPFASKDQIGFVRQKGEALRKAVGDRAVDRFLYGGDIGGFDEALQKYSPGSRLKNEGGMLRISNPDGTAQDFADVRGLATMLKLPDAVDRINAYEASKRGVQKDVADIEKTRATGLAALASARASDASAGKYAVEAAGERLKNQGLAALTPRERVTATSRGRNAPAEVQTAQWLMEQGVAKDASTAWELVRTARSRSPEDAIAALAAKMQADPMNSRSPQELVSAAKEIYSAIVSGDAAPPRQTGVSSNALDPMGLGVR